MDLILKQDGMYQVDDMSWNEAYNIYLCLKKMSDLIGIANFDSEYYKQEAARFKEDVDRIIKSFDSIPKGNAVGINDEIIDML